MTNLYHYPLILAETTYLASQRQNRYAGGNKGSNFNAAFEAF
tara:strand:+ start:58140 stop:58265 length:126 start_codon:yes stop_codon:yes gene_type:complete